MKGKRFLFLSCAFLFLGFAGGELYARNLSLDAAVALVLEQSNDIKKAEANVRKMQATLDGVHANRLPKADATAAYMHLAPISGFSNGVMFGTNYSPNPMLPDNVGSIGVSVSQPIYTFGKIGFAVDMARNGLRIAQSSRRLAEIEMGAAAVQLYWSARMTDELVKIAEKALRNTKDAQSKLTATGRANRSNLVKISADVASREIDLSDAKFNRDSAHRMLKAYAGIEDNESLVLTSDFPNDFQIAKAKEIQPLEWSIFESQAKMHDAEKWQNYMGWMPSLVAMGEYKYQTAATEAKALGDRYTQSASAGIALTVPLFDGGAKRAAATGAAMAAIAAREDLDKSRRLKTAEYADLIQKHNHLVKQLKDLLNARELTDKAYQLSRDRFLAGQTSATELSDVERASAQMDMVVINAKLQILITEENIKKYETTK